MFKRSWRVLVTLALVVPMLVAGVPVTAATSQTNGGTREATIPVGESASVGNFQVFVLEVIPDALPLIQAANQFNDPPTEGHQFYMVRLQLQYTGSEPTDPAFELDFNAVGNLGRGYSVSQHSCGSYDGGQFDVGEMFEGATAEMNACWEIASVDASSLVMYVENRFDFEGEPVWFSLGNDANVDVDAALNSYQRVGDVIEDTSREAAVPVGQTGEIGDWEVSVLSVTPDAADIVMAANQFNDPPADGSQFFMTRVSLAYMGSEHISPMFALSFHSVGNLGRGYTTYDNDCGVYSDDQTSVGDMFPGAVAELNVCWHIPSEDASSLLMYVEESFSFDSDPVWFSLGNDTGGAPVSGTGTPATGDTAVPSTDTETAPSGTIVEESSRANPIPMGDTGVVGDYQITVLEVIPNATDIVLSQNQFNDPPAEGNQFFMVRTRLDYTGSEAKDPMFELSFNSVGDLGRGYTTYDNDCGSYDESMYDVGEMFEGASAEATVCWNIPTEDVTSLVMYVEPFFNINDEPVWFALTESGAGVPEQAETATTTTATTSEDADSVTITLSAIDIAYDQPEITIPANTDVAISVVNDGMLQHDLVIDGTGIATGLLNGGASETIVVNLPPGTYTFRCTVPGHTEAGQTGVLIVE